MTAVEFQDIKIIGIITDGITEPPNDGRPKSALYSIPFALSRTPDTEWSNLFVKNWDRPPDSTTMHRTGIARVCGSHIVLDGTTIEEVEQFHKKTLQLAISITNQQYRDVQARPEEMRAQKEAESQEHKQHVEEISSRIKFD